MSLTRDSILCKSLARARAWRIAAATAVLLAFPSPAYAITFTVNSGVDAVDALPGDGVCATAGGQCTLRAAVQEANDFGGVDTINIPAGTYTLTIPGTGENSAATGDLDITEEVTIQGTDPALTIIDGNLLDRVFENFGVTTTISGLMIRNGRVDDNGAGIRVHGSNSTILVNLTLANNDAMTKRGGALSMSSGGLFLTNVTISGNNADDGGGIYNLSGPVTATNVTITANTVTGSAAGIRPGSGGMTFTNSIVAGNSGAANCDSAIGPGVNNLDDDGSCGFTLTAAPRLGPLQDNGGASMTHALLSGSPAVEGGTNTGCPPADQRGAPRPQGSVCDIGAVEGTVYSISGRIFVDIVGNGLADGPIGPLPNPFEPGTRIELWYDGGDGIPNGADDGYVGFATSSGVDGSYTFLGVPGTYWATVDSGSVNRGPYNGGYSAADAWAEQTYGPIGAASFDGAIWSYAPAAGAFYGGAQWDVSDNFPQTTSLPTAEHIARVIVLASDVNDVDFGFSFNVVTTTRGGDGTVDPGQPPGQRSVQGSLRQFLTNANAQTGPNDMRFVPFAPTNGSDGGGNDWWRIDVTSALPIIEDVSTTVDGEAYLVSDGVTVDNPNDANLGAGETVGVDGLFTTPILDPELELEVTGVDYGLQIDEADATVRNISIWKSSVHDIFVGDDAGPEFTGTLIEQNIVGTPPHRFDSSFTPTGNDQIEIQGDADDGTVQNNLVGFGDAGGVSPDVTATSWTVFQNEIRGGGRAGSNQDGVGDGAPDIVIQGNLIADFAAGGVDCNLSPGGFTIDQNTFRNNGTVAPETFQIRLMGTTGNSITKNIFDAGNGPAIIVVSDHGVFPVYGASEANLISQNQFNGNHAGIAIDLLDAASPTIEHENGDGINLNDGGTDPDDGNDGIDFPIIDSAALGGGNLTVSGFARPGVTIEFYEALGTANDQNGGGTKHGEGLQYLFTQTEGSGADTDPGTGSYASADYGSDPAANRFSFTVAAPAGLSLGDPVSAIAIDASNNTSEFGPNLAVGGAGTISGRVFDDVTGDGLPGPQTIGDIGNPAAAGVTVYLYDDTGGTANQPDATDSAVGSTTTAGDGSYSFTGLVDGTYWVVVDSKTMSADANVWGEQTYGPAGGWCADGAGGTTQGIGAAGVCYGGRRVDPVAANPSSDDLTTWHSGAEHIGEISVAGGDVTGVDFGFSFNAVTTTRGGDATDDDGANPRTVQGSLRQFIQNANAIAGANAMRFVPAEPANASSGGHSWWQILVSSSQPQVIGASTTIDGTAYEYADGITPRNTNTANIGSGAVVGVSGTFTTPQLDPELELRGDTVVSLGLQIQPTADGSTIRNLVINAFAINAVRLIGSTVDALDNATLENNVIGTSPTSFTDDPALSTGRALFSRDLTNATIRNNLAGWLDWGFQIQFDTFDSLIETNEIRGCSVHGIYAAGNAGTGQQPARITIRGNLVESNGSDAINTFQSLNQFTITENTLRLSGSDAVHLYPTQSTITANVMTDNGGTGLLIAGDNLPAFPAVSQTRISQNRFGNNGGLAIDLVASGTNADGITINDDLDADTGGANELHNFPVIESVILAGGNLTVTGFARPGVDIEFYESIGAANDQNSGGTAHGEGIDYLFTATEGSGADTDATTGSYSSPAFGTDSAAERFRFVVPAPAGLAVGEDLSAISIDATNDTSEFGPNVTVAAPDNIIKRAFLPDGTPVPDGASLPVGVEFMFLLYINNQDGAMSDVSVRDVLDPAFAYLPGSSLIDNSLAACAAAACTPAEEAAIFAAAVAGTPVSDAVDADSVSYTVAGTTIDAGNEFVGNLQLDILANRVWAIVFSVKMQ